ncbi:alpha/beta hydrolase [Actinomycetota bacterium]
MGYLHRMPPRTAALTTLYDRLNPPIWAMSLAEIQRTRGETLPHRPPVSWVTGPVDPAVGITFATVSARDGYEIPLRVYRPRAVRDSETDIPVVVYLHGGGFVRGNVLDYDPLCTMIARRVRAVVVSVDYRLAPEHKAPTAAYDCIDAVRAVAGLGGRLRADTSRLALCGDSAGGNLSAVVAQQLRGEVPIAAQALIYPSTDMTLSSPSISEHCDAPVLDRRAIDCFLAHYLPFDLEETDPMVSPLFGDLAGLPPTLVQTADLDPLRDDGVRYAEALAAAGVPVRCTNYEGAPHGFHSFPGAYPGGIGAQVELVTALRDRLYAASAAAG